MKTVNRLLLVFLCVTVITAMMPTMAFAAEDSGTEKAKTKSVSATVDTENVDSSDAIKEENTETSTTFDLGGNAKMTVFYGSQVRYKNEDGDLTDYDPTLVSVKDGKSEQGKDLDGYSYVNNRGDSRQYIPASVTEDTPILMEKDGYSVSMTPVSASAGKAKVKLNKKEVATPYEEVKNKTIEAVYDSGNVSYEYISQSDGIKENTIIEKKPSSNVLKYKLSLKGLKAEEAEDGSITLVDEKTGELAANIEKPFMNDASGDAYSEDIKTSLTKGDEENTWYITMTLSRKYLNSKERQYPVTVDPSTTWKGSNEVTDVYTLSTSASTNYYSSGTKVMPVGHGSTGTYRTYLRFELLKTKLKGKYIDSAKLTMYETGNGDSGETVNIFRLSEAWTASKLTWKNSPSVVSGAIDNVKTNRNAHHACSLDLVSFVRKVASDSIVNYGMLLKNASETGHTYTEFYGSRTSASDYRPKMTVVYYDGPTIASSVTAEKAMVKSGEDIKVSWAGIKSKNLANVQYRVATVDENDAIVNETYVPYTNLAASYTGSNGENVTIPGSSSFPEGRYKVYIRGIDAGGIKGTGKGAFVSVDSTLPSLTGVSVSPESTKENNSRDITPTVSWNASDDNFSHVSIMLDGEEIGKCTSDGAGSYTLSQGQLQGEGEHDIKVVAYDKAGNTRESSVIKYYADTDAPVISNASATPATDMDTFSSEKSPEITWTVVDGDLEKCQVYLEEDKLYETTEGGQCSFTVPEGKLTGEGKYIFTIKATDRSGNTKEEDVAYYLDTNAPEIDSISISPVTSLLIPSKNLSPEIFWNISDASFKEIKYSMDGENYETMGTDKDGSFILPSSVFSSGSGEYDIYVKAIDKAGNESDVTTLSYYADTSATGADFVPTDLSCIEYYGKHIVSWTANGYDSSKVKWQIHRSTQQDFTPSEDTLLKDDIAGTSYIDKEILENGTYYYKIVAVRKGADTSVPETQQSNEVSVENTVTVSQFANTIGSRDYLAEFGFSTPTGTGSIEESTGNLRYSQTDFELSNGKLDYGLERTYNSRAGRNSMLGKGWSDSYHKEIYTKGTDTYFVDSDGSSFRFIKAGDIYACDETKDYILTEEGSGYLITGKDDTTYKFNRYGQLIRTEEPNGCRVVNVYDAIGRLVKVVSNEDRSGQKTLKLEYDRENRYALSSIDLPDGTGLSYEQQGGELVSVTHSSGILSHTTWQYGYGESGMDRIYDAKGNLYTAEYAGGKAVSVEYPDGEKTSLTYGDGETQITGRNSAGSTIYTESATYDADDGRVLSQTDKAGNQTTTVYYADRPYLVARTSTIKEYETLENGIVKFNRTASVSVDTEYTYDVNDNVLTESSSDGTVTSYEYNDEDLMTSEETREDGTLTTDMDYEYDEDGNEISETDNIEDTVTETEYEDGNAVEETVKDTVTTKTTQTTKSDYDDQGNVKSEQTESANVKTDSVNTYDGMGRVQTSTDGKTTTKYTYDYMGRVTATETATEDAGTTTDTRIYDENGTLISETDGRGMTTSYTYDAMNRNISTVKSGSGASAQTSSTSYGFAYGVAIRNGISEKTVDVLRKESVADSSGTVVSEKYVDASGNTVKEVAGNQFTDYTYDMSGNNVAAYTGNTVDDKHSLTVSLYDDKGQNTDTVSEPLVTGGEYTVGDGSIATHISYDDAGNVVSETSGEGKATSYTYDESGKVKTIDVAGDGVDRSVTYTSNKAGGDTTEITDAGGKKTIETTNAAGLTVKTQDEAGDDSGLQINRQRSYDSRGNLIKESCDDGTYIEYAYDKADRMIRKTCHKDAGTVESETIYAYTVSGDLTKAEKYSGSSETGTLSSTCEYTYDSFGRRISESVKCGDADKQTTTYSYDVEGNLSSVEYPSAAGVNTLNYTYDSFGRLTGVSDGSSQVRSITYDSLGRTSSIKDYSKPGETTYTGKTYTYDDFGRTLSMKYTDNGDSSKLLAQYTYSYNKDNDITSRTEVNNLPESGSRVNETRDYTYDAYGRLTGSARTDHNSSDTKAETTYGYDASGNRTSVTEGENTTTYSYNGLDQLTSEETADSLTENTYDGRGNLSKSVDETNDKTTRYTYSVDGNMTQAKVTTGGSVTMTQDNVYDQDGIRLEKTVNGTAENYYYINGKVACTAKGDAITTNLYDGENIIGAYSGDDYYTYMLDAQGSTEGIVKDDGTTAAAYSYTDFGDTTATVTSSFDNEICYTGGILDSETGLYYLNARYYDPETASFISQDSYRGETNDAGQCNLYAYCAGDPINATDPSGHSLMFYNSKQHYWAYYQNAPQKYGGYCDGYDYAARYFGMKLSSIKSTTSKYRLQLWKGLYGKMYGHGVSSGCEIGLYYRSGKGKFWHCAYQKSRRLRMRMTLYMGHSAKPLFSRDSANTTQQGKAWWLTAFKTANNMPGGKAVDYTNLRMTGTIWFDSSLKYKKEMKALSKEFKKQSESQGYSVGGSIDKRTFNWKF